MPLMFPMRSEGKPQITAVYADRTYPTHLGYHTGWDCNYYYDWVKRKNIAGDGDLGLPFLAVADGEVKYISNHAGGLWGGLIVIWHEQYGIYSRYGHDLLEQDLIKVGDRVTAGQEIGRIGKGERGTFLAHLHIDFPRQIPGDERGAPFYAFWPGRNRDMCRTFFVDPSKLYQKFRAATPDMHDEMRLFTSAYR
ncbi:M23 family metallopeptidase [Deinococcus cellulosilyticus]|nr:M23 family metallopeptidase [Deinococcus cellulosilyticus]